LYRLLGEKRFIDFMKFTGEFGGTISYDDGHFQDSDEAPTGKWAFGSCTGARPVEKIGMLFPELYPNQHLKPPLLSIAYNNQQPIMDLILDNMHRMYRVLTNTCTMSGYSRKAAGRGTIGKALFGYQYDKEGLDRVKQIEKDYPDKKNWLIPKKAINNKYYIDYSIASTIPDISSFLERAINNFGRIEIRPEEAS
jgi:hypothetical protein